EIGIVVLIAATMVLFSLLTCLLARRSPIVDRDLASGTAWLIAANSAFLGAALALLFTPVFPLLLVTMITMAAAFLGLLFGYFAILRGMGAEPRFRVFAAIGAAAIGLQVMILPGMSDVSPLLVMNSIINGVVTLSMGVTVLRSARPYGRDLGLLVSIPFFAISGGFLLRLLLIALGAPHTVILTVAALNAFLFAFSALQWSFGLIALRAARLNESLVDERQRAEDLARSRTRFLAHMSHEIRTPLNSVLGLADVLQAMVRKKEEIEIVDHIRKSGDLLIHILNDILDVSKLEANAVVMEQRPFDVAALLHEIEASFAHKCRERGVALEIRVQPEVAGHWLGDPHRINQILHNVVGNAVKFTETGHVRVSADGTEQMRLVVEDTGIGMTEAQAAAMFGEFSQADEGITRRFGGTGLGMPIVHRLVTVMKGKISVESRPGHGTRICVILPLARAEGIKETPVEPPTKADFAALQVLCADDSTGNLLVLRKMLRQMGLEPQTVQDGRAAIRAVQQRPFDIYLLDISMPGLSGIETLHHMRQVETDLLRRPAYAVAATANVMSCDVDSYISSGFDTHLPKPIRLDALQSVLLAYQHEQKREMRWG
ncbi:MAG: response regulator, partial [Pararhodobacter sp.]|nr:response regulator [Pararhodobacter sp.]